MYELNGLYTELTLVSQDIQESRLGLTLWYHHNLVKPHSKDVSALFTLSMCTILWKRTLYQFLNINFLLHTNMYRCYKYINQQVPHVEVRSLSHFYLCTQKNYFSTCFISVMDSYLQCVCHSAIKV